MITGGVVPSTRTQLPVASCDLTTNQWPEGCEGMATSRRNFGYWLRVLRVATCDASVSGGASSEYAEFDTQSGAVLPSEGGPVRLAIAFIVARNVCVAREQ